MNVGKAELYPDMTEGDKVLACLYWLLNESGCRSPHPAVWPNHPSNQDPSKKSYWPFTYAASCDTHGGHGDTILDALLDVISGILSYYVRNKRIPPGIPDWMHEAIRSMRRRFEAKYERAGRPPVLWPELGALS